MSVLAFPAGSPPRDLARHLQGWIGYFGKYEMPGVLQSLRNGQTQSTIGGLKTVETGFGAVYGIAETG